MRSQFCASIRLPFLGLAKTARTRPRPARVWALVWTHVDDMASQREDTDTGHPAGRPARRRRRR